MLAAECRDLARLISYRPDRDLMLDNARRYEEAADRIEREAALIRQDSVAGV